MNLIHTVGDIRNFVNACAPISTDLTGLNRTHRYHTGHVLRMRPGLIPLEQLFQIVF